MMKSLPHDSAHLHVTGRSEFIDDRPALPNEVFVEVVASSEAHARIGKIDWAAAQQSEGVVGVFTAKDLRHNRWGTIFQDQPLLADDVVQFVGEPIALIAAKSRELARAARSKVKITYSSLVPVLSIDAAKENEAFLGSVRRVERGKVDEALARAPHQIKGQIVIRGAEHFYLENQAAIAYPKEEGQIEVHSSSQHPTETQHVVAHALGLELKDVVCIVKRMGGAFGGKESQAAPFAAYAALVAHRLNRPARIVLTKDDDMVMTGKRNPFQNDYRVGFDSEGRILALEVMLFSDGGAYADLSTSIMERAMLHCDNAYFLPNARIVGRVCKTNFHPHTAFRGFGGPKGVATIEKIIEEIAHILNRDPLEVRKLNVYRKEGGRNTTPYGQVVENNCLPALFDQIETDSRYFERRKAISEHNRKAASDTAISTLRGISCTAVKFGISFNTRFLNQANALVSIHRDGSVQVSTGATEMGQGVNARIAQLVSEELGLDRAQVRVMTTSTEKNANTSPTAASSGTDLNGAAAILAARKIKERLSQVAQFTLSLPEARRAKATASFGTEKEFRLASGSLHSNLDDPNLEADWNTGVASYHGIEFRNGRVFRKEDPQKALSFSELANEAYLQRVSLCDYAHYKISGLDFNKVSGQGNAFLYFTQGVAVSEVSLDRDTGEVKVVDVDILMDLGRPINEGLDIGQVTGGFIQGMGWVTTEFLHYDSKGRLLSHAPSTYKIPNVQDTPRSFRVRLIPNLENKKNLRGTKAVGEPPLLLSISVWTAIQDAIRSQPHCRARYPQVEIPATSEQVLRASMPNRFV